jgi:hypothetical protein
MTQKEIKELIKADEQRLLEAREGYKDIPEYQKIQEELDELYRKKAELENRKYQIQVGTYFSFPPCRSWTRAWSLMEMTL